MFSFLRQPHLCASDKASTYLSRRAASLIAVEAIQFIELSDPIAASLEWKKEKKQQNWWWWLAIIERGYVREVRVATNTVRYRTSIEILLVIYLGTNGYLPLRYHGCGESTPVNIGHKVSDSGAAGTFIVPVSSPLRNGIYTSLTN